MDFFKIKGSAFFKNLSSVFVLRISGMVLSYLCILFITNSYGATVFGRYSIAITSLQFAILIFSFGLTSSTLKLTADQNFFKNKKPLNNYLLKTTKTLFLSSLFFFVVLHFLKEFIAIKVFKDEMLVDYFSYISIFFIFSVFHLFFCEFLRARQKFVLYGLHIYVIPYLMFLSFLFLIYHYSLDDYFIILSYLISIAITALILIPYFPLKSLKSSINFKYNSLFLLSFPMMFSSAFIFMSEWTDVLMLGAMESKSQVGIYNVAYKLATVALIIINVINTVLAPKIAELHGQKDVKQIEFFALKATKLITILTLPLVIFLILFNKQILGLFGDEFLEGSSVVIVISIGLFFNAMSGSVGQILNMTKHQKELRNFTIITVIINIVLNYILINELGILGAAIASLSANIILNLLCIIYIKKKLGFYAFFRL
jgi:O-antigen/teichoic acid export membrane protein